MDSRHRDDKHGQTEKAGPGDSTHHTEGHAVNIGRSDASLDSESFVAVRPMCITSISRSYACAAAANVGAPSPAKPETTDLAL
jgi:hypothetical protein